MTAGTIHLGKVTEITEVVQHEDHLHEVGRYDLEVDIIIWNDGTRTVMRKP